ncbi:arsenite methyltransferase [Candidatus Bathyarchaeota archaeon]|nr:arsenite methyltransferase [Candidatus Bathyarchaeota archaeon]
MKSKEIKEVIKQVYTVIAESPPYDSEIQISHECDGTCADNNSNGCTCESEENFDPLLASKDVGYSEEELESIPIESILGLGCGNPVGLSYLQIGETVVDVGCGAGIDVFLASKKVGSKGKVIGIDSNESMISRAQETSKKYKYKNVEFKIGEMENIPLLDSSVDVVISNCVINLSLDKPQVFKEIYRVLKSNGKFIISDMVTVGSLPEEVRENAEAWASCIAGAEEKEKYLDHIEAAGFKEINILTDYAYTSDYEEMNEKIHSITISASK